MRTQPQVWAEAIFPIVLPAIRMAVTSALQDALRTFNQLLEHSFSLRSWRFRLEAWRTGRQYADVVLCRSLVYRVEQVLLLDRNTGLLLCSVAAPDIKAQDAGMVSAMLSAIQEFIHDSFEVDSNAGIRELHVGDFSLWLEQGPHAALAAAVRGNAPAELRGTLRTALDLVHRQFRAELLDFNGDTKPFEVSCASILEGCLEARYREPLKTSSRKAWGALAIVLVVAALWIGSRLYRAYRWDQALEALRLTPGIMITQFGKEGGNYFVEGLRDPLAASPERVLAEKGMDLREVSTRFEAFLSLEPKLVGEHARDVLNAPPTVSFGVEKGALVVGGSAPHAWLLQVRNLQRALSLAGIHEVRTDQVQDLDMESLRGEIESQSIVFSPDSSAVRPDQAPSARALAKRAERWIEGMKEIGRDADVELWGYTSPEGTAERNENLSEERAEHVAPFLLAEGVPRSMLSMRKGGPSASGRKAVVRLFYHPHDGRRREAR